MPYFSYQTRFIRDAIQSIHIYQAQGFAELNLKHIADEIQTEMPEISCALVDLETIDFLGKGQLLLWPVRDVNWPGRLPARVRAVLKRHGMLGLIEPENRKLKVITPEHYRDWLRRYVLQKLYVYLARTRSWLSPLN